MEPYLFRNIDVYAVAEYLLIFYLVIGIVAIFYFFSGSIMGFVKAIVRKIRYGTLRNGTHIFKVTDDQGWLAWVYKCKHCGMLSRYFFKGWRSKGPGRVDYPFFIYYDADMDQLEKYQSCKEYEMRRALK
jgi:hypothetical protein